MSTLLRLETPGLEGRTLERETEDRVLRTNLKGVTEGFRAGEAICPVLCFKEVIQETEAGAGRGPLQLEPTRRTSELGQWKRKKEALNENLVFIQLLYHSSPPTPTHPLFAL